MANLIRRRSPQTSLWRDVDRWLESPRMGPSPSFRRDVERMFGDFERMLDDFMGENLVQTPAAWAPTMELKENERDYEIDVELPGVNQDDVKVELDENNVLTVSGERKQEETKKEKGYEYSERSYGRFVRTIQLPNDVDTSKVDASFKDGVLSIHVPKSEETSRARNIPIQGTKSEENETGMSASATPSTERPKNPSRDGEKAQKQRGEGAPRH